MNEVFVTMDLKNRICSLANFVFQHLSHSLHQIQRSSSFRVFCTFFMQPFSFSFSFSFSVFAVLTLQMLFSICLFHSFPPSIFPCLFHALSFSIWYYFFLLLALSACIFFLYSLYVSLFYYTFSTYLFYLFFSLFLRVIHFFFNIFAYRLLWIVRVWLTMFNFASFCSFN